jgi:mannose-6-phosphate isomerase-like protein (cupin superfamily)
VPVIPAPPAPTHDIGDARFTSLATPSRGSTDTSVWRVEIDPDTPATPHSLTREEVFVVLSGHARTRIDGRAEVAGPGDAIVVPAGVAFELSPEGSEPLRALCVMPADGQASTQESAAPFTPPWAR